MLIADELAARREAVAHAPDLIQALDRLTRRAERVAAASLEPPPVKALLSKDGGVCPDDGTALIFDPWNPSAHRCTRCGQLFRGLRHDRAWARFGHLWLAERTAELAAVAVLGDRDDLGAAAERLLVGYADRYLDYPNVDNVLGPSRLFFSTYLESIWVCSYLAAAHLLREGGLLGEEAIDAVSRLADEAAAVVGEFDEGLSNRQTWNDAALAAIAVWFEDEDLARRAIEGQTGLLAHLAGGFGEDGFWYEGENYHLFALRGLLVGLGWAELAGVDPLAEPALARRVHAALRAPAATALPDLTFPARKDSRFGVSLAQPMYLELWEVGLARLAAHPEAAPDALQSPLWRWLDDLYRAAPPAATPFDSYLHEAGEPPPVSRDRASLSWWALLAMQPELPSAAEPWTPGSELFETAGLAVLRHDGRYASLECGVQGGGHGHPDRLHLTLFADGVLWLPDPGTGSYVAPDLFWYRSTLAHNAPRLDGASQPAADAVPEAFDASGDWAWARGRFDGLVRTLVAGPRYLVDVLEYGAAEPHLLELPWHPAGTLELESAGTWEPAELADSFVSGVERFRPAGPGPVVLCARAGGAALRLFVTVDGELLRADAPGVPGAGRAPMLLARSTGQAVRIVSVLEPTNGEGAVRGVQVAGEVVDIELSDAVERHEALLEGWRVTGAAGSVTLAGMRAPPAELAPLIAADRVEPVRAEAPFAPEPIPLDGTLDGFDTSVPLSLDHEDQYRRSEEPYAGPDELSATAYLNWADDALYVGVEVRKPELVFRAADAPPLLLDNEPDDIHSDGLQVYLRLPDAAPAGVLIVPDPSGSSVRVRGIGAESVPVQGTWAVTEDGYIVTLAITPPGWNEVHTGDEIGFDLIVNEMRPGRERRAGQLVWTGGAGWVWLRGDRQDPRRFGLVVLG